MNLRENLEELELTCTVNGAFIRPDRHEIVMKGLHAAGDVVDIGFVKATGARIQVKVEETREVRRFLDPECLERTTVSTCIVTPVRPSAVTSEKVPFSEQEILRTKRWRASLDAVLQEMKTAQASPERATSVERLKESIMWLGMDLKERAPAGSPPAYPGSYDANNPEVHPPVDGLKL